MTNEPHSEGAEHVERHEREAPLALDALPGQLGFVETPELMDLRDDLVEAMAAGLTQLRELATQYHRLAEEVVDQCDGDHRPKAQIGLIIAMGLNWRDANQDDNYRGELEDALVYADNMGYAAIVDTLAVALK